MSLAAGTALLLVRVLPPIIYRDPNGHEVELGEVILAARHLGFSIDSINDWPFYVHVAKLKKNNIPSSAVLKAGDLETIACRVSS
jgi:hypothetical protein